MNHKTAEHNSGASETTLFFCTRISKGPIPDVPVLGGESRRVGDNAPILQLQMMLRIRFGLMLKITVRTKSYIPPNYNSSQNTQIHKRNYNSSWGLTPDFPPVEETLSPPQECAKT